MGVHDKHTFQTKTGKNINICSIQRKPSEGVISHKKLSLKSTSAATSRGNMITLNRELCSQLNQYQNSLPSQHLAQTPLSRCYIRSTTISSP